MHHSSLQTMIVLAIVAVGQIAFHQMTLVMNEMVAGVVAVEEQRHRATRSIASSRVETGLLE